MGGGVESLTEGSWPFDQPSESNGPTPMATIDSQCYYGDGSDTGFELLDYIDQDSTPDEQIHIPFYVHGESDFYMLAYYGILRNGYNLPDFTKLSVDNTEYDIYPIPEQEPSTAGCYLTMQQQLPIDRQERVDEIKAVTGVDVKIGDTLVAMDFVLLTEQALSGDVPFTLYADQDSWSGTLHECVDTSASVYVIIDPNSESTAYELSVYTYNASNPYYKIGDDGEWTVYDSSNKPEFYLPGNYTIHLKATNNYDESEITNDFTVQIQTNVQFESHVVENPSAMFAGADVRVHLQSNYSGNLDGRDDVVFMYKEESAVNWESAAMTSTSDGYFAEVEFGWGHKAMEYKVQVDGVTPDETYYYGFDAAPMTPSFDSYVFEDSNGNIGPFVKLHFGANYPDMNTVETIEYSFDDGETWYDAVHDATLGCELAKVIYGEKTQYGTIPLKYDGLARTKLISDNTVKSQTADIFLPMLTLIVRRNNEGAGKVNINNVETLLASETEASIGVLCPCDFKAEVIPDAGFVFESCSIQAEGISQQSTDNPSILHIPDTNSATVIFEAVIVQSSTNRE